MKIAINLAALGFLTAACSVLIPLSAAAETTLDPEALALGESIVTIAFPPELRQAMLEKVMVQTLDQMRAGMRMDQFKDPGLRKILSDYLDDVPATLKPVTSAYIFKQMDAVAQAYARMFTIAELKDIAAFARSPSGRSYLQRSTEVMSDPAVAAVNTEFFEQLHALNAKTAPALRQKMEAYLKAHPEAVEESRK